jgi:bifunctional non-homologous end joining protein LigD
VRHDSYRLIVQRQGERVRVFTRKGSEWSDRYPPFVEVAFRHRTAHFVLDGEAVLLGVDGISDFDGLHSRQHNEAAQLYSFDLLVSDDDDIRKLPLSRRRANLARMLARPVDGIVLNDFE